MNRTDDRAAGTGNSADTWRERGGRLTEIPPADYWDSLNAELPHHPVDKLRALSDLHQKEIEASALPPPPERALELLDRVAKDGWFQRVERLSCPNCSAELTTEEAAGQVCQQCGEPFGLRGGVHKEIAYIRHLPASRTVDWVVAIHGMNTTGAWQETFSWYLSTTWGRAVPVAIYKYGIVVAGVILFWRRKTLQRQLRQKIAALSEQAKGQGFNGKPDVIAHSFGTWLFGHLLKDELSKPKTERLSFGRIILTGSILRPDYDWRTLQSENIVTEVLNHYGTADRIVPLAHLAIYDSGPSGQRGFDSPGVLNLRAEGFGHTDLLSTKYCFVHGKAFGACDGSATAQTHLTHFYNEFWKPFLTLPSSELASTRGLVNPKTGWRQLPWPLRGTLFPIAVLPLAAALVSLLVAGVGRLLWTARASLLETFILSLSILIAIGALLGIVCLVRILARYSSPNR